MSINSTQSLKFSQLRPSTANTSLKQLKSEITKLDKKTFHSPIRIHANLSQKTATAASGVVAIVNAKEQFLKGKQMEISEANIAFKDLIKEADSIKKEETASMQARLLVERKKIEKRMHEVELQYQLQIELLEEDFRKISDVIEQDTENQIYSKVMNLLEQNPILGQNSDFKDILNSNFLNKPPLASGICRRNTVNDLAMSQVHTPLDKKIVRLRQEIKELQKSGKKQQADSYLGMPSSNSKAVSFFDERNDNLKSRQHASPDRNKQRVRYFDNFSSSDEDEVDRKIRKKDVNKSIRDFKMFSQNHSMNDILKSKRTLQAWESSGKVR